MDDRDAPTGAVSTSYHSAPNLRLSADDGIEYAYIAMLESTEVAR